MGRLRVCSILCLFAIAVLFPALDHPAHGAVYGPLKVQVEPLPVDEGQGVSELVTGGYIEYRVTVENSSKTEDYQVRLHNPSVSSGVGSYLMRNSRTVQVPKQSKLIVSLFQPLIPTFDRQLVVEINGRRQQELVTLPEPFANSGMNWGTTKPTYAVLVSRKISQEFKDEVRLLHPNLTAFYRSEIDTTSWSPNWLGYTGYQAILMTKQEADALSADVALALRRYTESGGMILVQGDEQTPERLIPVSLRGNSPLIEEKQHFRVGFGTVRPAPSASDWGELSEDLLTGRVPFLEHERLMVTSETNVPVRGLLGMVILFAIGIGPLNVWLLTRKRKRMWLWWNVPLISLVTSLTIFSYSLLAEGVSGRGKSSVLTLLDEETHRATTCGYVSYYCPLTPSQGLRFSYDTSVGLLEKENASRPWNRHREGRPKTIDWTTDQHLDSGWIVPRVPAKFLIRKSETRRERLVFRKGADQSVTLVNGLGVDLNAVLYRAADGILYSANDVAPGQEQVMTLVNGGEEPDQDGLQLHRVKSEFAQISDSTLTFQARNLVPSSYLAITGKSPFLEDPLPGTPDEGSFGVVYGLNAGGDHGN